MTTPLTRTAATTLLALVLAAGSASAASARPAPDDTGTTDGPNAGFNCPLRRIDDQLVRCDNLTGAGGPAPASVPVWTSIFDR
jgi:hypothetical protein